MSAINTVGTWFDDRMNPVVIKELRQAVRSWFVMAMLMLFLAVQLLSIGVFLIMHDNLNTDFSAGANIFMVLQGILLATCLLFVPAYVGARFAAERSDMNVDLLFITTIRPTSIVWGKFISGMTVTVLIYSVCAPFMVLTYLLRGVDLASIGVILAMNLAVILVTVQLALLVGALAASIVLKVILGLILLVGIAITYGIVMGISGNMLYWGLGSQIGTTDFWVGAGAVAAISLASTGLLFFLTVASIAPSTSNRAMPVRIYITSVLVLAGIAAGIVEWAYAHEPFFGVWFVVAICFMALVVVATICERDELGARIRAGVPRSWLLRVPAWIFSSGAGAGLVWWMMVIGGILLAGWFWKVHMPVTHSGILEEGLGRMRSFAMYCFAYACTAVLIRRYLLPRKIGTVITGPIMLGLVALGAVGPVLVMFFVGQDPFSYQHKNWTLLNPFSVLTDDRNEVYQWNAVLLTTLWVGVALALLVPWFMGQLRQYRPLKMDEETASHG